MTSIQINKNFLNKLRQKAHDIRQHVNNTTLTNTLKSRVLGNLTDHITSLLPPNFQVKNANVMPLGKGMLLYPTFLNLAGKEIDVEVVCHESTPADFQVFSQRISENDIRAMNTEIQTKQKALNDVLIAHPEEIADILGAYDTLTFEQSKTVAEEITNNLIDTPNTASWKIDTAKQMHARSILSMTATILNVAEERKSLINQMPALTVKENIKYLLALGEVTPMLQRDLTQFKTLNRLSKEDSKSEDDSEHKTTTLEPFIVTKTKEIISMPIFTQKEQKTGFALNMLSDDPKNPT